DVEKTVFPFGMMRLGLRNEERVVVARNFAQRFGFGPWNIDRALASERGMVEVQHLVIEALQRAFGHRNQPDRQIRARGPCSTFRQMGEMVEVDRDVRPRADAARGGNQPDRGIRRNHGWGTFGNSSSATAIARSG